MVAVILLSLLFLPIHSWLYGTSLLHMSATSDEAASSLSYDIQSKQTAPVKSEEIAIVDISDIYGPTARAEIAELLETIYLMEPKRMGVDVFFPPSRERDNPFVAQIDSTLAETATLISDKTVFVCQLDSFSSTLHGFKHVSHPFFAEPQAGENFIPLDEGYANLVQDEPGRPISKYSLRQRAEGQVVWSFAAQVARDYLDDSDTINNESIIRFEPTDFPCMTADQLDPDLIRDRIVLVGDMRDRGDSHLTPLGMMQGVEIHAYAVQSILHFEGVKSVSTWWLMLLCLIVCFIYTYVLYLIDIKLDAESSNLLKFAIKQGLFTLATTYIITMILQYVAYISFTVFNTTLGLHALLPDFIKLVAFTKVTYSIVLPLLYKRFGWKWLRYSSLVPQTQPHSPAMQDTQSQQTSHESHPQ